MELYLNSGSDYLIRNEKGGIVTLAGAKEAWESGKVNDCNLAFQRLANLKFDLDQVKAFYAEAHRRWVANGGK